jgi:rhodanese-related sulfurtransferase
MRSISNQSGGIARRHWLACAAALTLSTGIFSAPAYAAEGLVIKDTIVGTGAEATPNSVVSVHYRGRLTDGTEFDSSYTRGTPIEFQLGAGRVIRGWDEGLVGMKVGGKRTLEIPPELGYGARGAGAAIPPNAHLVFDVELMGVAGPKYETISVQEAAKRVAGGMTIIDIRRDDEWQDTGIVEGAILLTAFDKSGKFVPGFPAALARVVNTDEPFMVLCLAGNRSQVIANALVDQAGYTKVINVGKGIISWKAEGLPLVKKP